MAFCYVRHDSPFLRQGEILTDLFEPKVRIPETGTIDAGQGAEIVPTVHPHSIVVSQDCDLRWDHEARGGDTPDDKLLSHILFCSLFTRDEIVVRSKLKSDLFKRVRQNQDERYQYLNEAAILPPHAALSFVNQDYRGGVQDIQGDIAETSSNSLTIASPNNRTPVTLALQQGTNLVLRDVTALALGQSVAAIYDSQTMVAVQVVVNMPRLPELVADFKSTFSLTAELVHWLVSTKQAARKGTLPSPFLEDFMHRLYAFLGRVATP